MIFFLSASKTAGTVSPKKRKNNRGKPEDVACSDTENSDPKKRLSFAEQDGMFLQTNVTIHFFVIFSGKLFSVK